jgi:hypothetical protein
MVDTAPVDTQTARRVGTRGSGGPPNLQKVKLTGSFEIDSVITTEAVFWIRVMTSGSNFGNNYSGGGGGGFFVVNTTVMQIACSGVYQTYLIMEPFWGYKQTEPKRGLRNK